MRVICAFVVCACLPLCAFGSMISYSGSLTSGDGGVSGTGLWVDQSLEKPQNQDDWTPAQVSWTVSQNADGSWHYEYQLSVYRAETSHVLIQSCPGLTEEDVENAQGDFNGIELATWSPLQGNSNPSLPDAFYGIKFDNADGTTTRLSFDCTLAPKWGDFYAKSGKVGGEPSTAWNSGFGIAVYDPIANGSVGNKILMPGCPGPGSIPEPATLSLLAAGGLAMLRRRIR